MSSTTTGTAPVDSSSASPSPTTTGTSGYPQGASNQLYLFTFLTTLLLLLAVSCGIVLRSFILRRRFRRRVEQAIAAGVLRPEHLTALGSRGAQALGEKPKMWEAWINTDAKDGVFANKEWKDMLPVAAAILPGDDRNQTKQSNAKAAQTPQRRFFGLLPSRAPPSLSQSSTPANNPNNPSSTDNQSPDQQNSLEVTVLIAMPTPHRPTHHSDGSSSTAKGKDRQDGEEELPEVAFGVVEMSWKAGVEWKLPVLGADDEVDSPKDERPSPPS